MTTVEIVVATKSYQKSNNAMLISPSLISIFTNAIAMKKAGYSYNEWLKSTGAGLLAKEVVKEIFEA